MQSLDFVDYRPEPENFLDAVVSGLSGEQKHIPPKFFYDERGSQLFDAICEQPEYYVPRVERRLLERHAAEIAECVGAGSVLIEPGSGSCEKVRLLLDALRPAAYAPLDISADYLRGTAGQLAAEYPWLKVVAGCVDFAKPFDLPDLPEGRRVVFFPGSSLGNFEPTEAREFLRRVHALVGTGGGLLIGVDVKKDCQTLDAAYNDEEGVTAAFNLNLLERINRELDGTFSVDAFDHHAFYDPVSGRVEMHLVSERDQQVRVDGHRFAFDAGETIHTESSYKYRPQEFHRLASEAGFESECTWQDEEGLFSVHFLVARPL